jgi:3-deoxy-manno-octulosonate cytidylyltransferase (CMP-KDO synthetase)
MGVEKEDWLEHHTFYKHVGVYAYRTDVLRRIAELPVSRLEAAERLEQNRWLENGYKIRVEITNHESVPVDTPEDLERIQRLLKK